MVRVTTRQERLARVVAEETKNPVGKTKEQMMLESGYSKMTAKTHMGQAFTAEGFKHSLKVLGVDEEKIANVFREAIEAKTVVTYRGDAYESDVPDHKLRVQAADKLSEITGMKKKHVKVESVSLNLTSSDVDGLLGL